uniref:Hexosyltransferase n=1 Tax=Leptobrachium leishanense TaxID=445787 RepID=A0A8C5LYN3_9ANUR
MSQSDVPPLTHFFHSSICAFGNWAHTRKAAEQRQHWYLKIDMCWERRSGGCCRILTLILLFTGFLIIFVIETILNKWPTAQDHLRSDQYKIQKFRKMPDVLLSRYPMLPPYPYPYEFIINQEDKCSGRNPFLVALVISESHDFASRNSIRKTWGNVSNYDSVDIVIVFLVGLTPSRSHEVQKMLEKEDGTFRDIIQQNFLDTYHNLSLKTVMGMEWVAKFCTSASYVMKIDSDVFLNVEFLVHQILWPNQPVRNNFFVGQVYSDARPRRNKMDKWYVPEEVYPSKTYPPYCAGSGYVFSVDMAKKIYDVAQIVRVIPMEDVFVGLCLKELHIPPVQFLRNVFNRYDLYNRCTFQKLVTVHMRRYHNLQAMWQDFWSNKSLPCK